MVTHELDVSASATGWGSTCGRILNDGSRQSGVDTRLRSDSEKGRSVRRELESVWLGVDGVC